MSENARKIDVEKVFEAIMSAATGTIKVMSSTLEAAKTIALITYDVLETLKENGIIVEPTPQPETPATNIRSISTESKIAHNVATLILQDLDRGQELVSFAEKLAEMEDDKEEGQNIFIDIPKKRRNK